MTSIGKPTRSRHAESPFEEADIAISPAERQPIGSAQTMD
jgi:hypothetical protein